MAGRAGTGDRRAGGGIETPAGGALRVKVYAGVDPVTHNRHYLTREIPL